MISSPLTSGTFVGRNSELAFLLERFRTTARGQFATVILEGEAGIGKSRLINELRTSLPPDAVVAAGSCLEYARAPYLPINDIFKQFDLSVPAVPAANTRDASSEDKLGHFSTIATALQSYVGRRTLVMVIEDVQWADDATTELIQHLCRALPRARILLVLSCRSDAMQQMPSIASLFARLSRMGASRIRLGPLTGDEVRSLVATALRGRTEFSADLLRRIEQVSDGNPLFVEELLRTALEHSPEHGASLVEIPLTIRAMLWERILPLSNRERDILTHAAVMGRSFDTDFLASITGRPRKQVLDVLQRACVLQLVVAQTGNPPTYIFRHSLLRETLYRELLTDVSGPLHARIAAKLEELPDADEHLAERAYHWTVAGIEDKAIECNERAGDAAAAVYAYSDAIRFYRQALQFRYPSGRRRAQLYERLGRLFYLDGRESEPATWLEKALEEYRKLGDREGLARVFLDTAHQCWLNGETQQSVEAATPAVNMLALEHADGRLLSLARITLARFNVTLGRSEEALHQLDAVDPEALSGEDELRASFEEILAETQAALGQPDRAVASYAAGVQTAEATGDTQIIVRIRNSFAITATDLGEFGLARTQFEHVLRVTRQHGLNWRHAYAAANYAYLLMLAGELARARDELTTALSVPMNGPLRMRVTIAGIPLGLMINDDTLVDQASDERAIDDAFRSAEAQRISGVCGAFAGLYAARGDALRAKTLLERAISALPQLHRSWPLVIEVARYCDAADIERILELLQRFDATHRVAAAHVALVQALRAHRFEPSESLVTTRIASGAARLFAELGWPRHEALCLDLAGDPIGAIDIYDRIGASRDGTLLRSRAGMNLATHGQSSVNSPLTKRQSEVAALVARGASNREISRALSISENTVEHHISEIFSRLGIASRSQLIARMATADLGKDPA